MPRFDGYIPRMPCTCWFSEGSIPCCDDSVAENPFFLSIYIFLHFLVWFTEGHMERFFLAQRRRPASRRRVQLAQLACGLAEARVRRHVVDDERRGRAAGLDSSLLFPSLHTRTGTLSPLSRHLPLHFALVAR